MIYLKKFVHTPTGKCPHFRIRCGSVLMTGRHIISYRIFVRCRSGTCRNILAGQRCEFGLREQTYVVLTGSVLNIWTNIEKVLVAKCGPKMKHQVVRLKTMDGFKTIGAVFFFTFGRCGDFREIIFIPSSNDG